MIGRTLSLVLSHKGYVGYSQGFNTYSQQQTQTQGAEINVKGNGNYMALIKSKQVEEVLKVVAIRHQTIITGMGMNMIAAFNQTKQTLVAK